jgi:cytochrome c6
MRARRAAAAALGAALLSASAASHSADIVRGGALYRQHCANCHGHDGVSVWPGAPNIARREGMLQTDQALLQKLRTGRGAKPGFQGLLTDRDLMDVIAYSRTLMR